jgi:hypothetical protein
MSCPHLALPWGKRRKAAGSLGCFFGTGCRMRTASDIRSLMSRVVSRLMR